MKIVLILSSVVTTIAVFNGVLYYFFDKRQHRSGQERPFLMEGFQKATASLPYVLDFSEIKNFAEQESKKPQPVHSNGITNERSLYVWFRKEQKFPQEVQKNRHHKWSDSGKIFDVVYEYDTNWRRVVPLNPPSADQFFLVLGGSFAFGEGMTDDQTLSNQLARRLNHDRNRFRFYNHAHHGYGPNDILDDITLSSLDRFSNIEERSGVALYWMIEPHFRRLMGGSVRATKKHSWLMKKSRYYLENGQLKRSGLFKERWWENWLFRLIHMNYFSRHFQLEIPSTYNSYHHELFSTVIKEIKNRIQSRLGPTKLIFLTAIDGPKTAQKVRSHIVKAVPDVLFLDYSEVDFFHLTFGHPRIRGDGHPTPQTISILAQMIQQDMEKAGW